MVMQEHVTWKKKKFIIGKNPIQATTFTVYKQSHNPRMHEHMNKMLENAMHDNVIT